MLIHFHLQEILIIVTTSILTCVEKEINQVVNINVSWLILFNDNTKILVTISINFKYYWDPST